MTVTVAPYGSWKSPITADLVGSAAVRLGDVVLAGDDVYWVEGRPLERGRNVVVRRSALGALSDVTPSPYNVRTRANEYGGGAFAVADGTVYFANFADQRLYRQSPGEAPACLTPAGPDGAFCYADLLVDRARNRLVCVREDHAVLAQGAKEVENALVALPLAPDGGESEAVILARGADFYSTPRLSPDGSRLAWLQWNHPNMPWDGSELWTAPILADGTLGERTLVAGGPTESVFQPEWSPSGVLHFVSDRTGWWNLYRLENGNVEPLCPRAAEFGRPQWVFGMRTYAFADDWTIVCGFTESGSWKLGLLDTSSLRLTPLDLPLTEIASVSARPGEAVFAGGSPIRPTAIVSLPIAAWDERAGSEVTPVLAVLRESSDLVIDPGYLSTLEAIEFPTENGLTAHGFYYRPRNRDFAAPDGERPPLLVLSHGGPTSATSTALRLSIQFWTSRGIGVLDVNYGGSTGYGRAYWQRLNGNWGVVDVDDCANGARYLVARSDADPNRLAISGGSAGGFTTLCALAFRDVFQAGASHYGVSDLEALATDTHKFESHYTDSLVAPYPAGRDLYHARSPLHHPEGLNCPAVFFQGLEDKVVLPNQTERMVEALRKKGVPVAYVAFAGEQHGFRQAPNIRRALEGELYFYSRVFGFPLADAIEPLRIENFD